LQLSIAKFQLLASRANFSLLGARTKQTDRQRRANAVL